MFFFARGKPIMRQYYSLSIIFSGIFIALLLFLSGCQKQKNWKIGFIGPISGDYASSGRLQKQAVESAIQAFSEKYGLIGDKEIQLVVKDSQGETALTGLTEELIQEEKIIGLIGPTLSSVGLAIANDFQNARIPLITGGASYPTLTSMGNHIFRTIANDDLVSKVLAHYLRQQFQVSEMAIFYIDDVESRPIARNTAETFRELGGNVLLSIGIPKGITDYSVYLEAMASSVPAAIFLPIYSSQFVPILAQIRKDPRYQNTQIFSTSAIMNKEFFDLAGDMAEGVIVVHTPSNVSYETSYFEKLYKVRFGTKPIFTQHICTIAPSFCLMQ